MKSFALFLSSAVALTALDQISKYWIRGNLAIGQSMNAPWPGIFEITHTENHGIAFGMFQGGGVFFAPLAIVMAVVLTIWSYRKPSEPWYHHVALGLLASGAIGNMYDRLRYGKVTDMLWFRAIDFPVFNLADSWITIGAGLLILASILESRRTSADQPAAA